MLRFVTLATRSLKNSEGSLQVSFYSFPYGQGIKNEWITERRLWNDTRLCSRMKGFTQLEEQVKTNSEMS